MSTKTECATCLARRMDRTARKKRADLRATAARHEALVEQVLRMVRHKSRNPRQRPIWLPKEGIHEALQGRIYSIRISIKSTRDKPQDCPVGVTGDRLLVRHLRHANDRIELSSVVLEVLDVRIEDLCFVVDVVAEVSCFSTDDDPTTANSIRDIESITGVKYR